MDKSVDTNKPVPEGISIRNGPIIQDAMDIDQNGTNGKRKARTSNVSKTYKDESASEDDTVPLVSFVPDITAFIRYYTRDQKLRDTFILTITDNS